VGGPARVRRTLTAIDRTLDDLVFVALASPRPRGAGLRGGTFAISGRRGLVMRRLSWAPGVRISGTSESGGSLRMRIGGPAAARGRVTLSRAGVLRGRLGGRRVAVGLGAGPPGARAARAARAADAGSGDLARLLTRLGRLGGRLGARAPAPVRPR